MTEKRFTFTQDTLAKADVFDGDEFVCCTLSVWVEQLVDLLNGLNEENKQLKSDNFNLNKTVEYLNETVKEQCNKLDWASECSVRWEEEYTKWIGD